MYDYGLLLDARRTAVVEDMKSVDLVLTVTPGRSGSKLLAEIVRQVFGVAAEHEPEPRANYALRPTLNDPNAGLEWLVRDKLPVWSAYAGKTYVETSHLYCKGLLEPLLALGIRPRLVALRRPASDVAASLFQMDVIPARTDNGDLVLLRPDDPGVLPLPDWSELSDYALCYWYALEIERRQAVYCGLSLQTYVIEMADLVSRTACLRLAAFLGIRPLGRALRERNRFRSVIAVNQNPRSVAHPNSADRPLPPAEERAREERDVVLRTCPYWRFGSERGVAVVRA